MRKKTVVILVACAMIGAAAVCTAQPQRGPAGPGRRGGFRWGQFSPPGPPAPVPAEVAMPRPTLEEVAKINAEFRQFIETNTSANRDLLKKYASLLVVQVPRDNPCIRPSAGEESGHGACYFAGRGRRHAASFCISAYHYHDRDLSSCLCSARTDS